MNLTDCLGSDGSSYDNLESSSGSDEDGAEISHSTPQTPFSSVSSPRFPSNLKTIPCSISGCEKLFNRPAKLAQHLRSHTNTRPFVCSHLPCTKDFLRKSHLKHHIKSAHSEIRDYICQKQGCGKSFSTGTRLRRHNAVHEGQEKFRCEVIGCGQSFRKHGTLQKHVMMIHEGKSPFTCKLLYEGEECGAGFDTAGKLKSHQGRLHGGNRFWCTVCSPEGLVDGQTLHQGTQRIGFSTYAALQAHIVSYHPPTCFECGLRCKSHRELKVHVDIIHGDLGVDERRTHACAEPGCGRGFTKKGNLTIHTQTAHGERRFVCGDISPSGLNRVENWDGSDACGRAFASKHTLEEHIRTAHLGLDHARKHKRKDALNKDGKIQSRKKTTSSLVLLTGSGYENESGRNIACLVLNCDYRFMRLYDLQIHLEFHHGLTNLDISNLLLGSEKLVSRPGWDGLSIAATTQDLEAEQALDMQFEVEEDMEGIQVTLHPEMIAQDNPDNVKHICATSMSGTVRVKDHDMSTQKQCMGKCGGQDIDMIDPILR